MAKTKTPFLSLGASGSVGRSITAQKRGSSTLVRSMPLPAYRYTLLQAYQRWLYEDYAYLWRQQSEATQAEYRAGGSRFHLTGFQYWMKVMLSTLPDIISGWHLDEKAGTAATDFSKNAIHGTIVGASFTDGLIDGALYFDGLNDKVTIPRHDALAVGSIDFTLQAGLIPDLSQDGGIFGRFVASGYWFTFRQNGSIGFAFRQGGITYSYLSNPGLLTDGVPAVIAFTMDMSGGKVYFWVNGIFDRTRDIAVTYVLDQNITATIGYAPWAGFWAKGVIDHLIIHNRLLDPAEILRHSLRRYP